ncbi:hypothetical protein I4J48_22740, partial [Pseudonocardia sp. KRD-169]|nr:hypothetical protein [Pseudonocardia abyssalis]
ATTLYQRSLDRTRDTVVARIRPVVPAQRGSEGADTVIIAPVPPPRRRWRRAVVGALVVFVLGLAAVTGLEWANGSSLTTDETGTSVSRVIAPEAAPDTTPTDTTEDSDGSSDSSSDEDLTPSSEDDGGSGTADPSATPEPTESDAPATATAEPTTEPTQR